MAEKKKKNKNNTKYSGHFVPQQSPRAAHALRSDQKIKARQSIATESLKKNNYSKAKYDVKMSSKLFLGLTYEKPCHEMQTV